MPTWICRKCPPGVLPVYVDFLWCPCRLFLKCRLPFQTNVLLMTTVRTPKLVFPMNVWTPAAESDVAREPNAGWRATLLTATVLLASRAIPLSDAQTWAVSKTRTAVSQRNVIIPVRNASLSAEGRSVLLVQSAMPAITGRTAGAGLL